MGAVRHLHLLEPTAGVSSAPLVRPKILGVRGCSAVGPTRSEALVVADILCDVLSDRSIRPSALARWMGVDPTNVKRLLSGATRINDGHLDAMGSVGVEIRRRLAEGSGR